MIQVLHIYHIGWTTINNGKLLWGIIITPIEVLLIIATHDGEHNVLLYNKSWLFLDKEDIAIELQYFDMNKFQIILFRIITTKSCTNSNWLPTIMLGHNKTLPPRERHERVQEQICNSTTNNSKDYWAISEEVLRLIIKEEVMEDVQLAMEEVQLVMEKV